MDLFFYWFDHLGVAVFAISGTLLAFRKNMDGFGVIVLASVTAIGGGTVRDLILGLPVFWVYDPSYLYTILIAAVLTILWLRFRDFIHQKTLLIADAFGLAFFAVMGAQKALLAGFPPLICVVMGTITACFGGMIRDVLARDVPMLLKGELYATTCLAGGSVFVLIAPHNELLALLSGGIITLLLRLGAIKWKWYLAVFQEHGESR
ncbi:trimeric intracellular cation channel family protein [Pseudidiomarina sediminum]|uniref:Trimeric intracellular cation channel family protein n=1 Tax=Pseudidiomarina sediminum TaxID=431675 RepID=A0A432Z0V9_9GAMM|nr:trimeric intracellular cation channel family protein [Pseudidiomarina sediminum]MBY6064929.1 trimeric intracellular cation channel family protein [Pseudidiomarina sediminum]RUO69822.1 trimeric intracellular cation channel family protein [Pseudidiomarina sediminum]